MNINQKNVKEGTLHITRRKVSKLRCLRGVNSNCERLGRESEAGVSGNNE
jgi:hypothetical protein